MSHRTSVFEATNVSRPLRIALLVNPFTLRVKGGDHAPELARELLGRGHTVRGFGAPAGAIPRSGPDPESPGGPLDEGVGLFGYAPEAVIAYEALSPAAWLGARAARRCGAPLLLIENGSSGDGRWKARTLRRIGESLWGGYVRHTCGALAALDPLSAEHAIASGFAAERVSLLPPGVDLNLYRPGLSSGLILRHHIRGRILLYVGSIGAGRGLEVLIDAFAQTVGQRQDWSLVLAGDGPLRPSLRARIDRLGIGSVVHWTGRVRDEELPGLMSASTLLAVPALDASVRGQNIPRAMAAGLPVIVSDRPALRYLVEHEGSGLVAPAGDVAAWSEVLRRASMSPEARKRWSQRSRAIAVERLAWSHVASTIESLLLSARGEMEGAAQRTAPLRG